MSLSYDQKREMSRLAAGFPTPLRRIASVIFLTYPLFLYIVTKRTRTVSGRELMRSTAGSVVVLLLLFLLSVVGSAVSGVVRRHDLAGVQPLSRVAIHKARLAVEDKAYVTASPLLLGIKAERDGSNEYNNYQPGSLNTTDMIVKDLDNIDIVFHIGDITYANGYISQWDQFTAQVEPITSRVPYMLARYSTDFGMFHFCIADTEHDWREGSEQYKFIEHCLASADRKKQPWLIFAAHRVLGYSSGKSYVAEGSFEEPMGRESLQKLWQKYRVDMAFFGHVHNYERTCPIYQNQCVNNEKLHYSGMMNGTIHVVVGGGGSHLSNFSDTVPNWSIYRDLAFGFVKLTAFNHSSLLFEYKRSSDGKVYDSFTISRDYRDVLACVHDSCPPTTLAT
ncbi:hypothetical protein BHM03_00029585 [Ensete ventricosum]|nr:hypothetical protein BHM03_00029585 [Ensete ventricosum]